MKLYSKTTAMVLAMSVASGAIGQQVIMNDDRIFDIDEDTVITRNGEVITPTLMVQVGTGYVAEVQVGTGTPDMTRGTLDAIQFDDRLAGPITSLDPLMVFNTAVIVTGDTLLVNIPGDDLANLMLGDELLISGLSDVDSSVLAARLELADEPLTTWRIEGYAENATATTFSISTQPIDYSAAFVTECTGDVVANGDFAEVEATPDPLFTPGTTIIATEVDCDLDRLDGDGNAVVEGLITSLIDENNFIVAEQMVQTNASTSYVNGTADDLEVGARVEVEGTLDDLTDVLTADKVKFRHIEVRFEAPMGPGDVVPGESVTIMQNTLVLTAQTRDEDGIGAGGLAEEIQVEVRGFMDLDGNLYATRVRERGDADLTETEARGPASNIADPNFEILGIAIDSSFSAFQDAFGMPITAEEFFALIVEGTPVSIEDATYDPVNNSMVGGVIAIEDEMDDTTSSTQAATKGGVSPFGQGIGTITGIQPDAIFSSSFE
ncbi:MAG: hypothetical protein DHS20C11_09320 [Lysobacteraceae bacterium]|nr:MAG: hypothetical protein DHS20C11_09320 [Xanthomonadaceae bacterium]